MFVDEIEKVDTPWYWVVRHGAKTPTAGFATESKAEEYAKAHYLGASVEVLFGYRIFSTLEEITSKAHAMKVRARIQDLSDSAILALERHLPTTPDEQEFGSVNEAERFEKDLS